MGQRRLPILQIGVQSILRNIFSENYEKTFKKIFVIKSDKVKNSSAVSDPLLRGIPVKKASQQTFTCSNLPIKTLEKSVKHV